MDDTCTCTTCALSAFVAERYPSGLSEAGVLDLSLSVAKLSGKLGAQLTDRAFDSFLDLAAQERRQALCAQVYPHGGLQ